MYVFLLTKRGRRGNVRSDIEVIDFDTLIEYIKDEKKQIENFETGKFGWNKYAKVSHLHEKDIRIAKLNDDKYTAKLLRNLSLNEFENIFKDRLEDIKLLIKNSHFRSEVKKKYGKRR